MALDLSVQQQAAEALRHELDLGHGLIDPFAVAEMLGIEVVRFPVDDGSIEGVYRPTDLGGYMFVNSASVFVRQRFTAAHELGHHRLHGMTTYVESTIDSPDDWEAHRFAEALLVDRVGAQRLLQDSERDVRSWVALASHEFWVSPSAAACALKRFGLLSEPELASFLSEGWSSTSLLTSHGFEPRPDPVSVAGEMPTSFRDRAVRLVLGGQISRERAAEMLGVGLDELPMEPASPDPLGPSLLEDFPDGLD